MAGEWATRTRQAWRQQYLDVVVAWACAELRIGNPTAVIGPLTDLAGEHPLVESITAVLMRAMYATGRASDALDTYTKFRQHLIEEVGADPGAEVQAVHQAILRGDLDLSVPPALPGPTLPAREVPQQLPLDVPGFTGREDKLAQLDAIAAVAGEHPTAVVISAVSGTAGVGKTALAVHWAHQVAAQFPDGQLYVNLRGFDPGGSLRPTEAIRGFLEALRVIPEHLPGSLPAQAALYRSLLAGKRVLIVLDNARDADQVRPLLPGSPGCLVVVTSRNQLTSLVAAEGAHPISLDLLSVPEARQLLTHRLGEQRVVAEPEVVGEIISRCARLPLALTIAAARAATNPGFPLISLAEELSAARDGLDAFDGGDVATNVRTIFSWSYRTLSADAARLFRLLGPHPGPDVSAPAAASLAGLAQERVRPLLGELARAHLIIERSPRRYTFHDLLRAYATELTNTVDAEAGRRAALHRLLDHYLHTAFAGALLLRPGRHRICPAPIQAGVTPEDLADYRAALTWLDTELPVLLAAIQQAAATGFNTHAWQLAWTLTHFFESRGHWHHWIATQQTALDAAHCQADRVGQAHVHHELARAYALPGRYDDARAHLRHALDLYGELGDHAGQLRIHEGFTFVSERQGRHEEGLRHAERALELSVIGGEREAQARSLGNIGWCHAQLGDFGQALNYCQQGLTLDQENGDRNGEAGALDNLGFIHYHLGHHSVALAYYQQALDLYRDLGDRYHEGLAHTRLGDFHSSAGDWATARGAWQSALEIYDEFGHPDSEHVRAKLQDLDRVRPTGVSHLAR
jgi:tetratricopeptide (TPR) repeat protein